MVSVASGATVWRCSEASSACLPSRRASCRLTPTYEAEDMSPTVTATIIVLVSAKTAVTVIATVTFTRNR